MAKHGYWFDFHGLRVRIPENSAPGVGNALLRRKYEREEASFILKRLPNHLPVIELGGSLGVVSALIRSKLLPETPHVIVEANPGLIEICRENAGEGAAGTTQVLNRALGYGASVLRFAVGDSVHASHLAATDDKRERTIEVAAVTLAELAALVASDRAFALVCDIEGGELDLVRNEQAILRNAAIVIMELHQRSYPFGATDEGEILRVMEEIGFRLEGRDSDVCLWVRDL